MRIQLSAIPQDIIEQYDLETTHHEGWVYIEIHKIISGLKQAGRFANDRLCTHLKKYGHAPVWSTSAIWKHETRKFMFTLVVDDFGIKFTSRQDAYHLASAIEYFYVITKEWEVNVFRVDF